MGLRGFIMLGRSIIIGSEWYFYLKWRDEKGMMRFCFCGVWLAVFFCSCVFFFLCVVASWSI